ncbi:Tetratricopeptide repeat protein [Phycisphaerae bacterium RAS2]|nr:Tetratricopeptide repeat protein [Phycisphaerae bacterium RAS2]
MLTLRYGASELDTILCKNTLGMILTRAGDTKEAEEILKSTLQDLDADKLGPHYKPARSLTMNSLGVLYHQINDYKKAIESYSESLALLESIPEGASPFDVALVRSNLADNLRSDHRLDEARRHIEQVIAFFRQHESKHSTLAKALLTAGRIEKEQGNVEKGCSLMNEALTIAKSVWPTDHPELIKMQAIVDQCDE